MCVRASIVLAVSLTACIGADGLSMDFGPSANDLASADLHRQVVANALSTILLVDHNKFGGASLFQIVDWSKIATVITDQKPDAAWLEFFNENEITILYPGSNGQDEQD